MAETEAAHIRPPEPITITVCRARNLRGSKGDAVNCMVKAEFGEKSLGESPKVDCTAETPAEFNFNITMNCTYDDPLALDEIAHKPIVLTVIEVMPKERRQKEEKTIILGQCTVDLLPLVKGETTYRHTLTIHPLPGSPLESLSPEHPRPEMDVMLAVNEPLLDENQLKEGNLMTVTVESLFSPPETWQLTGTQYYYTAALPVPCNIEKEMPIVFPSGQLKPGPDKEMPNKQKRWAAPGAAVGSSVFIPDSFITSEPIEDEDGDFKGKEDREHRQLSEAEKLRVVWNTERRCYLEAPAAKRLQDSVAKNRYWPVEIFRLPQPPAGKGKGKDDDGSVGFHGVVFLNLAPLLYPGVKRIRGAYKVLPYSDHLLHEKTKRKYGIGEDAARLALNLLNRNTASPPPKKGGKDKDGDKKDQKKGATGPLKSDTASEVEGQAPVNVEGQQYADAKSYIMIDITLSRPLVPKRPPEELARRVAELVPPRPLFPKRTDCADRAVEDYHGQIASVAALILEEFRDQFGDEMKQENAQTNEAMENRRQKLMYHLNSSGKYFAFKEQLKHSVIKIVREKYLRTTNFDDRQQLQTFLSELYVYLVDQMHQSLNKVLQIEDQPPIPPPLTTSAQLKHFAREAEVNQNYELATKYYQERIIREENNADNWFDFGTFCLYINNVSKAEECFNKCISINQKHLDGLMLYGVVCTLAERNEAAETFFEAATNVDPRSTLAWTMLGLFYDFINVEIRAEMAYLEANKLNVAKAVSVARASREEEQEREQKEREKKKSEEPEDLTDTPSAMLHALEVKHATPMGERSPTSARSSTTNKGANKGSAGKRGKSLTPSRPSSQIQGSVRGTPHHEGEHPDVEQPPREPTPVPTTSIFMQAVDWLLEVKAIPFTESALAHELLTTPNGKTPEYHIALARLKLQKQEYDDAEFNLNSALEVDHQFAKAKTTFLMACKKSPSCVSWLGVGISCYRLDELSEAEDALMEANILNNTDAEVWGYLSLVCLRTGRKVEAEQSYKHAVKLNLQDGELLNEIHAEQRKVGYGNPEF
ncbi:hypothetical protein BaRGS_00005984 [Batillaria attramentaria]|uniref:Cilia- and flagella-associated protein 70 n=1 Tax=Batillaria attramentaria TaxID=370345 RepID=A0ABD0LUN6_9CAEN